MKKSILSLLCLFSIVNGMEKEIARQEPREWDPIAYAQGNALQQRAALQFLKESDVDPINKKVLDIGCGTGNITDIISQSAKRVRGIDASKQMIEYAQQHSSNGNIS